MSPSDEVGESESLNKPSWKPFRFLLRSRIDPGLLNDLNKWIHKGDRIAKLTLNKPKNLNKLNEPINFKILIS